MRIAIVLPSLSRDGGTERIACFVANGLAELGHDVLAITRYPTTFEQQPLAATVGREQLYVPRGPKISRNLQLPMVVRSLRRTIRAFDAEVVIGMRWDCAILALLAARGLSVPVVAQEHVHMPVATLSVAWRALRRLTYPRAAALVLVDRGSVDYAKRFVGAERVRVIDNFVLKDEDDRSLREPSRWSAFAGGPPGHKLLALGRLEHQKGFDLLIEAYSQIAERFPDWGLMIVGRGSEEEKLGDAIARAGLHPRVQLTGAVTSPIATYRDSDLFVFPSRYEGFPLTLVEAMSEGLPVVAFDCPSGPRELIAHEIDGLLVPNGDVRALSDALARAMSDETLRLRLGAAAPKRTASLTLEAAIAAWTELLDSLPVT